MEERKQEREVVNKEIAEVVIEFEVEVGVEPEAGPEVEKAEGDEVGVDVEIGVETEAEVATGVEVVEVEGVEEWVLHLEPEQKPEPEPVWVQAQVSE